MQQHRKFERTRMQKNARILLKEYSKIDCVVRDLTNTGAGIQLPKMLDLPETLDLTFDRGRSIRSCRLVWRSLDRLGVKFL
jgi:hypothetical protein